MTKTFIYISNNTQSRHKFQWACKDRVFTLKGIFEYYRDKLNLVLASKNAKKERPVSRPLRDTPAGTKEWLLNGGLGGKSDGWKLMIILTVKLRNTIRCQGSQNSTREGKIPHQVGFHQVLLQGGTCRDEAKRRSQNWKLNF